MREHATPSAKAKKRKKKKEKHDEENRSKYSKNPKFCPRLCAERRKFESKSQWKMQNGKAFVFLRAMKSRSKMRMRHVAKPCLITLAHNSKMWL